MDGSRYRLMPPTVRGIIIQQHAKHSSSQRNINRDGRFACQSPLLPITHHQHCRIQPARAVASLHHHYFASAAVAVDSSHMTASSSAAWSRFSPPSNFVNGNVLTIRIMVCCWSQSNEGDWARPHLCNLARHGP